MTEPTNREDPLVKALPPASDYLTYLTIIEYNLTKDRLPLLHDILQDETLTTNIGWDLVHVLLPFLPEAEVCLEDVARLGNPREVILKVTELLEGMGQNGDDDDVADSVSDEIDNEDELSNRDDPSTRLGTSKASGRKANFLILIKMLETLHYRIKTKFPSRFLSTSLNAIIQAYSLLAGDVEVTSKMTEFANAMLATTKPALPPRNGDVPQGVSQVAPDPEDEKEALSLEESQEQNRLLQAFLLQVIEAYGFASSPDYEDTGFAWSTRFQELLHPERRIPGRLTHLERFSQDEDLATKERTLYHLHNTALTCGIPPAEALNFVLGEILSRSWIPQDESKSSSSPPLPMIGSILFYCISLAKRRFHDNQPLDMGISLFPDFASLVTNSLGGHHSHPDAIHIGTNPPPTLIDALLFLGSTIFATDSEAGPPLNYPQEYEAFHNLLQNLSLISLNCPLPSLRYNAHVLTSQILHAHPDAGVRLRFIADTLEDCPFENLKGSAVGWVKEEVMRVDRLQSQEGDKDEKRREANVFLDGDLFTTSSLKLALLPILPEELMITATTVSTKKKQVEALLPLSSYLLASLNFWIFLFTNKALKEKYHIVQIAEDNSLEERWLAPLKDDIIGSISLLGTVATMVSERLLTAKADER